MPRTKEWRPRMTDQLRLLVKELNFVAKGTTSNGKQVVYMNEDRNAYCKIFIPIENYADMNLFKRIISDLIEKFHYTKEEIVEAGEKLSKPALISNQPKFHTIRLMYF